MKIKDLLKNVRVIETINYDDNMEIDSICDNSTYATKRALFVSINGYSSKGENYILDAENKGAVAVVCTHRLVTNCAQIIVENERIALSIIAGNFYNNKHKQLKIIGVVGTNGKSSCSQIIFDMFTKINKKVGLIGTNIVRFNDKMMENNMTTPDPIYLHNIFYNMANDNVEYVVMEVSAHAIFLNKVYGIKFETLLFTNISQDHLDFFKTMETYAKVKMDFFNKVNTKSAVINIDDDYGVRILNKSNVPLITYGIKNPSDIFAIDIRLNLKKSSFVVNMCDDILMVNTKLIGLFNVYNILGTLGVMKMLGFNLGKIQTAVQGISAVEGRFMSVDMGQKFNAIIDYAHTPKSMEIVLNQVRKFTKGNIITVFGCPGNRDETKRSIMGEIAGKLSNFVIITTDNPQYENAYRIIREIELGVKNTDCQYLIVEDREMALRCALSICEDDCSLVVIGKGAETYQNINGYKIPYNDKKVLMICMEEELKQREIQNRLQKDKK